MQGNKLAETNYNKGSVAYRYVCKPLTVNKALPDGQAQKQNEAVMNQAAEAT